MKIEELEKELQDLLFDIRDPQTRLINLSKWMAKYGDKLFAIVRTAYKADKRYWLWNSGETIPDDLLDAVYELQDALDELLKEKK